MKVQAQAAALAALTFFTASTMGNTPYPLTGYGLGAYALFLAGLLLPPLGATISVGVGFALAAYLLYATRSIFLLVAVAAVPVRALQAYVFARLKVRVGVLGAGVTSALLGAFIATLLAIGYYGEGGISASLAFMDVLYLYPAHLTHQYLSDRASPPKLRASGLLALALGLYLSFLSASTHLLPGTLALGLALLTLSTLLRSSPLAAKAPRLAPPLLLTGLLLLPLAIGASGQPVTMALRAIHYPFYPDSLARAQWEQKSPLAICWAGDTSRGVWGPERLRVLSTCQVVVGRVVGVIDQKGPATDEDFLIDIIPEPEHRWLTTIGSLLLRGGAIHVEVVPFDQPGVLTGLRLKPGDRVMVVGALVLDTDHGWWTEIHPTWVVAQAP